MPAKAIPIAHAKTCLNFSLRRTSRLVNQYYDRALKPAGLRASQFNLMVPLALRAGFSLSDLATLLGMERSALARNLKPLQRRGWIEVVVGTDRRTRVASLTQRGRRRLEEAYPLWERAQQQIVAVFDETELERLTKSLRTAADAAAPKTS